MIRDGVRRVFRLALQQRDRWEREVEDEIKLHLTLRAEQLVERGVAPADAYDEAVRRFGPLAESRARLIDAARHREKSMQRAEYLADLGQDLAFAFRTLKRDAGWTAITVLTLALGIGATTAVFSVVSNLLLHAVAYPHADRIVILYQQPAAGNNTGLSVTILPSMPVVRAWKGAHSVEALEPWQSEQVQLETTGQPASVQATRIGASFPTFGGVRPVIGRMFTTEEAATGAHDAVLGEGLWRTRFGADRSVIGKVITLAIGKGDSTFTVVGVLPAKLQVPSGGATTTDIWLPIDLKNDSTGARVVARLTPGTDEHRATQELDSISSHLENGRSQFRSVVMSPSQFVPFRDSLVMLAGAVALVLLVACANVAHLLMARSASRRRELAIRVALGAGRGRVFRQLLTESVVIATSGGVLGVLIGMLGLKAIVALRPSSLTQLTTVHVDTTTLELALVVTLATSIAFGLLGALSAARESTNDVLKNGGTRLATAGRRWRGRQLLVVTEMALSATLVVGASMLVRSVINLQHADLGFEPKGLYAVTVDWPASWAKMSGQAATYRALDSRVAQLPGVQSVALASNPPSWFSFSIGRLEVDGEASPSASATSFVTVNSVGTGYFSTMKIRLVEGTAFTDTTPGSYQVIVNERFARKQWQGASPLGKRLRVSQKGDEPWLTIVGVAADAATGGPMMAESTAPLLYTPAADSDARAVLIRANETAPLLATARSLLHAIDPALSPKVASVATVVRDSIAAPRFVMTLLTVFTVLALLLAAVGLYGVMSYTVAQRTREIGIRVALGATRSRIARGVVTGGVALAIVGCVFGGAISFWGSKLIENQLYGVATHDAASFAAAVVVLFLAAGVACVVPVRRALAVDPMTAIRAD